MPIIPIIPSVNTCMKLTSTNTTTTTTTANPMPVLVVNTTQLQLFADVCSTVTSVPESVPAPIMNSLVSATKVVTNESLPNPVAAAVMNLAIPTTIPISSIPGPIMSINTTGMIEDCAEDKGNMSEPLEDDAVIENDLEQQQLDESAGKRKSMEIPLFVDEELKTEEEVHAKLDLDENEVKIVDASEENVTVNEEVGDGGVKAVEPMECGSSLTSPKHVMKTHFDDVMMSETTSTCSGSRQVESSDTSLISNAELAEFKNAHEKELTCADIMLLCDYLPLEHGRKALQLLAEFHWLRINAQVLCKNRSRKPSLATTPTAGDSCDKELVGSNSPDKLENSLEGNGRKSNGSYAIFRPQPSCRFSATSVLANLFRMINNCFTATCECVPVELSRFTSIDGKRSTRFRVCKQHCPRQRTNGYNRPPLTYTTIAGPLLIRFLVQSLTNSFRALKWLQNDWQKVFPHPRICRVVNKGPDCSKSTTPFASTNSRRRDTALMNSYCLSLSHHSLPNTIASTLLLSLIGSVSERIRQGERHRSL
ncbi:conserved hypothetical protein [Culex quinquefasciatus]|uniref:Uncharacterized protein n=1 Tax=Culex quinquefasciatus TaxID=7176 RepID=B0X613_CULQU|nr:conserved hypothetical protein [Culex quinquefasciatus]|eukprot:XP_001865085.1 conserved hypothetical protein [Culex quinquefasciatus]